MNRRPLLTLLSGALSLWLVGCIDRIDADAPVAAPEPVPVPPGETAAPSRTEETTAVAVAVPAPEPPPTPIAEPKLRPNAASRPIEELIGQSPEVIEGALGAPDTIARDAPPLVWRYRAGPCSLDFQFFQDLGTGVYRALQYEVAGGSADGCLGRLERRHRG